jgi:hypothetical protein
LTLCSACERRPARGDEDETPSDDDSAGAGDDDDDSTSGDDDTADDDDDTAGDDDTPADDDDTPADDDDTPGDDDDTPADDDDDSTDPLPGCMASTLSFIETAGALPAEVALGPGPTQQLYSCETYQLLDVRFLSSSAAFASAGAAPSWTLGSQPQVTLADSVTQATLSLSGCNPYTCGLYTNTVVPTVNVSVAMAETVDGLGQHSVDVTFGVPSSNISSLLQFNFILTGCSVGNLNEDLQANGVDIFTVLVADVAAQFDEAVALYLTQVEADAEAQSLLCWP